MKKLSIVVHESAQQQLADFLRSQQLDTFMFSHIEEHSSQMEHDRFLSDRDKVVGYVPQVRLDVILSLGEINELLGKLKDVKSSFKNKGIYWITDVYEFGNL